MKAARATFGAALVALAALGLEPGCTGALGLATGTPSDGGLGAPCDTVTDSPTPCMARGTACVLNTCRNQCGADTDCAAGERCIAADSHGGPNNGGAGSGSPSASFGCVPAADASCAQSGCSPPHVCDPDGQCRTGCSPGGSSCASDQTCVSMGGAFACYGPHDDGGLSSDDGGFGFDGGGGSSSGSGGSDSTVPDSGPTCTGTPTNTSCAQCQASGSCACPGCSIEAGAGICSGTPYTCSQCGSAYACSATMCPDCVSGSTTACTGTPSYGTCASCPTTYCGNPSYPYCPGCSLNMGGSCTGTLTPCSANPTPSACSGESGCTWATTNCSGTPPACGSLATQTDCTARTGCRWSSTTSNTCAGSITPCEALSASACSTQPGCTVTGGGGPIDAGSCDGTTTATGPVCNCLSVSGAPVSIVVFSGTPPPGSGGVITPGTYVLTSVQFYPTGGGPSGSVAGSGQSTLQVSPGMWQQVTVLNGGPPSTDTAVFSTRGTTFTATRSCPDTGVLRGNYSATASSLMLEFPLPADAGPPGTLLEMFSLQ